MYYKELLFQGSTIRFINSNIVLVDIYQLYNQRYSNLIQRADTIYLDNIINKENIHVLKEVRGFETYTFAQVHNVLDYFKANNIAVEIFRNWLSNFAYVYIEDFIINSTKENKLQETLKKLQAENTKLKAAISKVVLNTSSQNYSLDILSKVLGLDIDIQTGVSSSITLNKLQKDINEIKSILCEQVGLEYEEEEKESIEDKLKAAFKALDSIYGVFSEHSFNRHFLRTYGINLNYRAENRGLTMVEYIATDKDIIKLVLDYIPKLVENYNK